MADDSSLVFVQSVQRWGVSRETLARIELFWRLAQGWNRTVRLFAEGDPATLWHRHVIDSLQLLPWLPAHCDQGIDIGSGGGFPGLVVAIATGLPFILTEPDRRKAAFLAEAARLTKAPATVLPCRIEATDALASLITARAVATLRPLCALAAPHLTADGICLFLKGAGAPAEVAQARQDWTAKWELLPSVTEPTGHIVRVRHLRRGRETGVLDTGS